MTGERVRDGTLSGLVEHGQAEAARPSPASDSAAGPVPRLGSTSDDVDESGQRVGWVGCQPDATADRLGGVEREAVGEQAEGAQELAARPVPGGGTTSRASPAGWRGERRPVTRVWWSRARVRSSRAWRSCTVKAVMRLAAISIASGRPSRPRTMPAIAVVVVGVEAQAGLRATGPLEEQTASVGAPRRRRCRRRQAGTSSGVRRSESLAAEAERLAAGRHHA